MRILIYANQQLANEQIDRIAANLQHDQITHRRRDPAMLDLADGTTIRTASTPNAVRGRTADIIVYDGERVSNTWFLEPALAPNGAIHKLDPIHEIGMYFATTL